MVARNPRIYQASFIALILLVYTRYLTLLQLAAKLDDDQHAMIRDTLVEGNIMTSESNSSTPASCVPPSWSWDYSKVETPLMVPSFPGSGAELFRDLVRALMAGYSDPSDDDSWSLAAMDVYSQEGCHQHPPFVVTCKTHWPAIPLHPMTMHGNDTTTSHAGTAIVLMRHPLDAIPSWGNYEWEIANNISSHTQKAPKEDWERWRDIHSSRIIQDYQRFVETWSSTVSLTTNSTNTYAHDCNFLLVPYHEIIDPTKGPILLAKIMRYLLKTHHQTIPSRSALQDTADCLWRLVVQERASSKRYASSSTPDTSTKPEFRKKHRTAIRKMLQDLMFRTRSSGDINWPPLLTTYLQRMNKRKKR